MTVQIVNATQVSGDVVDGQQCLTTEAKCPFCGIRNKYKHLDSHYSDGRWYGCKHLCAFTWAEDGYIESAQFQEPTS